MFFFGKQLSSSDMAKMQCEFETANNYSIRMNSDT